MLHTVRPPVRQVKTQRIDSKGVFYWGGAASTSFFCDPTESIFVVFATALLYATPGPWICVLRSSVTSAMCLSVLTMTLVTLLCNDMPFAVRVTVPACWFAHVLAISIR